MPSGVRMRRLLPTVSISLQLWYPQRRACADWQHLRRISALWSASRCVFEQAVADEYASGWLTSTSVLLALVKAFEKVGHGHIHKEALVYQFPLRLLRVLFSLYSLQRRICLNGFFSVPVSTEFGIVAGSRFGTDLLRLSITSPLDKWASS